MIQLEAGRPVRFHRYTLAMRGTHVSLATFERSGVGDPVIFLHGLGTTKEDFADAAFRPALCDRHLLGLDFPGFGETRCDDISIVDVPFLVETLEALLKKMAITRCHLVGHSMGGLVAQLAAERLGPTVRVIVSIEGNLTPQDCLFSRCVEQFCHDPDGLLGELFVRARAANIPGAALYATGLRHKLDPAILPGLLRSLVAISDTPGLIDRFVDLTCRRSLLVGQASVTSLSYLDWLRARSVPVRFIAESGHFPMYSNPQAMWAAIEAALDPTGFASSPSRHLLS
ncbi:alpha/beta fold hydrolase [Sphingobium yanoikuyae]|uniref:alpha/beta fold hydrolase n=1 Tax=Sphingobium yanoikuyae TaxID=13690 RepID=UPI0035C6F994